MREPSALAVAARRGYEECIALLLAHSANPNATGADGSTPLHLAARRQMQWSRAICTGGIRIGRVRKQQRDAFLVPSPRGHGERAWLTHPHPSPPPRHPPRPRLASPSRAADALAAVAGRCLAAATPSAASVSDELDRAAADVVDGRGDAVSALLEGLHLSHLRPKFAEEDVRDLATCALLESDELERLGLDADAAARFAAAAITRAPPLAAPAGLLDAVAARRAATAALPRCRRAAWLATLAAGSAVDARDSEGRWFDGVVTAAEADRVRVHFRGWQDTWDVWIETRDELRLQPPFARTDDWRASLAAGDACEVRDAKGPMWFQGRVVGTTEEAVAVRTSTGVVYDVARASERLCRIGTHGARGRTPARPVST